MIQSSTTRVEFSQNDMLAEPTLSPRLVDVAKKAGVSPATVSRVLNHSGQVNSLTRTRVLDAVEALGYVHSPTAPAVPASKTIAVFITDILNPVFPEFLRGVEDEIGTQAVSIQIHNVPENAPSEKLLANVLGRSRLDGVIAFASHIEESELLAVHSHYGLPLVVVNRRVSHPEIPSIVVDFEDAAYRSARHLIGLGHSRIGFLAGLSASPTSTHRLHGIKRALAEIGQPLPEPWNIACFPNIDGGFQAMSRLLALPRQERPSALITYNDLLAFGALHAVRVHGLNVPDDLSVVGCDGIALSAHSNPPLTTIEQPKYRMGRLAMQILARQMSEETKGAGGYTLMESPLIIRESTAVCSV